MIASRLKLAAERLRKIANGESLESAYNFELFGHDTIHFEHRMDQKILIDAYLAKQQSTKFACDHCGAFFRVEVVGVHHPKRGVVMCPFCGNEPKKVDEK